MAEEKLRVTILVDRKDFERGLKDAAKSTEKFQKSVNSAGAGLQKFFLAAGGMTAVFNLLKAGFKATGEGADRLTEITAGLKAGLGELGRAIVSLDFDNFAEGLANSVNAATGLARALDQVNQRMRDLQVIKSSMRSRVSGLRLKRAEGTITAGETAELEQLSSQLLNIETDIYAEGIASMQNYIAERTGLNKELFARLEQGVTERAQLGKKELDGIADIGKQYEYLSKKLKEQFPDKTNMMMVAGKPTFFQTASQEYVAAISQWISALSAAELAQLTEDKLIGGEDEWKQFIDFLSKRNDLTGEYALEMAKVARANNVVNKEQERTYGELIPGKAAPLPYLGMDLQGIAAGAGSSVTDIFEGAKSPDMGDPFLERVNAQLEQQIILANELSGVFSNMFSVMDQGWSAMADALIESLQRIAQEIISKAAVWAIMQLIFPGSGAVGQFLPFVTNGLLGNGGGGANGGLLGSVGSNQFGQQIQVVGSISGTSIALAGARGSNSLYNGT